MKNMSILYAEDEELTRANYAKYLNRLFKDVFEASNGEEAYKKYIQNRPDIMLLDIDMPKLDGLEVAKMVRQNDKKCRIIMLTAIKDIDKLIFATELNLTKYLPKPINRQKLKEALYLAKEQLIQERLYYIDKELVWNIDKKELFYQNDYIKLTKYERKFLDKMISKRGQICSQEEIIVSVWGEDELLRYKPDKLKDLVKRIRKKLPFDCIENIYSMGYRIVIYQENQTIFSKY